MRKLAVIIFACITLYGLFGFLIAPRIITAKLPGIVQTNLKGSLSIGAVKVNPFTLSLSVDQPNLQSETGESLISADNIFVNVQASSLFRQALYLKKLGVTGPRISAERDSTGRLNLEKLFPESTQSEQPDTSEPLAFMADEVTLKAGSLDFAELREMDQFKTMIQEMQVTLTNLSTARDQKGQFELNMALEDDSSLQVTGQLGLSPLTMQLQVDLGRLPLPLVSRYLQDQLPAAISAGTLSTQFQADVSGNPLEARVNQGSLDIEGLVVELAQSGETLVDVPQMGLSGIAVNYPEGRVNIESIDTTNGIVSSWLSNSGVLNWRGLGSNEPERAEDSTPAVAGQGADDPAANAAKLSAESADWEVAVNAIAVKDYTLQFEDRSLLDQVAKFNMADFDLSLNQFSTRPGSKSTLQLQAVPSGGGSLAVTGELAPMEGALAVELALDGLDLTQLQPYLTQETGLLLNQGLLDVTGNLNLADPAEQGSSESQPAFAGTASVGNFEIAAVQGGDVLASWQTLTINNLNAGGSLAGIDVGTINWEQPFARVIINEDRSTNIQAALTAPAATAAARVAAAQDDPVAQDDTQTTTAITIDAIEIQAGNLFFSDRSLTPRFETGIEGLEGRISDLSSESLARADVDLKGSVDRYAPVSIKGQINPLSESAFTDITLDFDGIELTSFTPYSGRFAGHSIRKGKLNLDLHYRLSANVLEGENKIFLNQLALGERIDSPDATGLPVNLAIALLKDRNGNIDLDIPVRGNLDDPEFSLGGVIVKAFVGLITKVVTSPFGIFGKLIPGGGEDLQYVDFEPGATALTTSELEKVSNLAEGLFQRPQLSLEIAGKAHPDTDGPALARLQFAQTNNLTNADIATEAYWAAIYAATGAVDPASASATNTQSSETVADAPDDGTQASPPSRDELEQQALASFETSEDDLRSLASQRAQNIRAAVLEAQELNPESIFILAPVVVLGGGESRVRVDLTLSAGD